MIFTAIVLAADRRPADPVARAAGAPCKALSPVGGVPMVLRVLEALAAAEAVGPRLLCGPPRSVLAQAPALQALIDAGEIGWIAPQDSPSASAAAALAALPETAPVLVTTADHALLDSRIVDAFCTRAQDSGCDVVIGLAAGEQVAAACPELRRTVIRLSGGSYCGCNLFAFLTPRGRRAAAFWRRVEAERKHPLRMIGLLSWRAVIRYALGQMTLAEGLERLSRRLELRAGAVVLPFPEAAIDVDSVADWRFAESRVGTAVGPGSPP